ncbi:MAG TPA: phosphatase PAP2 family protein [Solirubrobacterales bacterium]|jgi:undecaprenyl-diphosphatase
MDFTLFKALNGFAVHRDGLEDVLRFFAMDAQFFFAALLGVLFFSTGKWRSLNGRHGVVAAGFSALLGLGIGHVIADVWSRARPYEAHPGATHLFIAPSHDPSFPSDHATAAFAIAVSIWLRNRKAGWLALAMATVLALSRVMVGVHYPSDVIAGALLGTGAALILWLPPIRRPLHALAEWAGSAYERILDRLLRRSPATS